MTDLMPWLTFHSNVAVVVAQIIPTLFIAVAIQVHAVVTAKKHAWDDARGLVRFMAIFSFGTELLLLLLLNLGGPTTGYLALLAWTAVLTTVLLQASAFVVLFNATIRAAEVQAAEAVPVPQSWWARVWSAAKGF